MPSKRQISTGLFDLAHRYWNDRTTCRPVTNSAIHGGTPPWFAAQPAFALAAR
jgi:hypothetical protein